MPEIDDLMNEFDILLKKYSIDSVILINDDDGQMGYNQLNKIIVSDEEKVLLFKFSGKGNTLCPCCASKQTGECD